MKILKWLGIVVAALLAIFLIGGVLLPNEGHVTRTATVNASPAQVYALVNNVRMVTEWSPWLAMDTTAKLTFTGPASGVGASYSWDSEVLDKGTYTITSSTPERITVALVFGQMSPSVATFTFTAKGNGTEVQWTLDTDAKGNLFERWFNAFIDPMVGPDFEKGLASMEKPAKEIVLGEVRGVQTMQRAVSYGLGVRKTVAVQDIAATLTQAYSVILQRLNATGRSMAGAPMAIYRTWDGKTTDMEAVIPVATLPVATDGINAVTLPGGTYLRITYAGPYEGTAIAHAEAYAWFKANGIEPDNAPFEEYVTDPGVESDKSKWITNVWYRVAAKP